jgi:hypothetical protein
LSRYSAVGDLSTETAKEILLNQVLRGRLEAAESEAEEEALIQDALLEQLVDTQQRAERSSRALENLQNEARSKQSSLNAEIEEERQRVKQLADDREELQKELIGAQADIAKREEELVKSTAERESLNDKLAEIRGSVGRLEAAALEAARRRALIRVVALTLVDSVGAAWLLIRWLRTFLSPEWLATGLAIAVVAGACAQILGYTTERLFGKGQATRVVRGLRLMGRGLWTTVFALLSGAVATLVRFAWLE